MKRVQNSFDNYGWGYVICFGTVVTFIAGIGHVNCFGLIYNDFMIDTASTAKSLTTAHGVFSIMLAIGGLILNHFITRFPLRLGGIIGSTIFCVGSFLNVFITNTNQMPLTFGVLQGIGFGMMVPVCYSTFNQYYVKKRTTVMSICKAIQGIVLIWYPLLLKKIMALYGFRGTLLIISGIGMHTVPGMFVMRTYHNRSNDSTDEVEKGRKTHENIGLFENKANFDDVGKTVGARNSIKNHLLGIINIKSLKDPVFWNICIGQSFVNFSDLTFFILQPMLLFQYGFDEVQVVTCISICAGADVAGRCTLAIISCFCNVNTRVLFYIATLFTFLIRILILQISQYMWVAIVTGCLGVLRAWLHVASPLVVSSHVSHQDFPGAYALFMLTAGVINVTFSPIIGLIKDVIGDYVPAFYALTICCIPCLLFWPIEYGRTNKWL